MRCSPPQTPSTTCSNSATPWSSISTCGRQKNIWSGETWGAWSHHHRSNTKRLHDWPGPTLASSALSSDKNLRIELKKQGVAKRQRPPKPPRNPAYPTKLKLGLRLLGQFRQYHPTIMVQCVLADALYGSAAFVDTASAIFGGVQVISQLRSNQKVRFRNRTLSVAQYFARTLGGAQQTSCAGTHIQRYRIRGGEPVTLRVSSARLYVDAQGKKRFVVALKYEGETEYRYLVASDLTWRTEDIVQAFTLRWLVEVFFEDWKGYEGWSALTMQPGAEGSSRSLILSLLVDQCLLLHPDQLAQLQHRQPAFAVGSLINRIKVESVLTVIREVLTAADPEHHLQQLSDILLQYFDLRPSEKHMVGRDVGCLEPSPSLKYNGCSPQEKPQKFQ